MPAAVHMPDQVEAIPEPPPFPDLAETQHPEAYLQAGLFERWYVWVIIAVAVAAIAGVVIYVIRKRRRVQAPTLSPAQQAIADITQLSQREDMSVRQVAVEYSLILREYLTGETQDPALYETQQEFNRRTDALNGLPAELQGRVRDLLDRMAALKYEPEREGDFTIIRDLARESIELIEQVDLQSRHTVEESDLVADTKPTRSPA